MLALCHLFKNACLPIVIQTRLSKTKMFVDIYNSHQCFMALAKHIQFQQSVLPSISDSLFYIFGRLFLWWWWYGDGGRVPYILEQ